MADTRRCPQDGEQCPLTLCPETCTSLDMEIEMAPMLRALDGEEAL